MKTKKKKRDYRTYEATTEKDSYNQKVEQLIALMERESTKMILRPYQDFNDGIMYYGIKTGANINLLSSNRRIIGNKELYSGEVELISNSMDKSSLSATVVDKLIKQNIDSININDLYRSILDILKRQIYLENSQQYDILTVWIMGTYIYTLFDTYMYLWINGAMNTGKTTLLTAVNDIAFNAILSTSITPSVMFRSIHSNGHTICFDECENLTREDNKTLREVINSGYKKGAKIPRCNTKKNDGSEIEYFEVYSPKVLVGIKEIPEELISRCYKITTVKRDGKAQKTITKQELSDKIIDIKDKLYLFGLLYAKQQDFIYRELEMQEIGSIRDRQKDKWLPLLSIAKFIDSQTDMKLFDLILKEAESESTVMNRERIENCIEYKLLKYLNEYIENAEEQEYKNKEIYNAFTEDIYQYFFKEDYLSDILPERTGRVTKTMFSRLLNKHLSIGITAIRRCHIGDPRNKWTTEKAYMINWREVKEKYEILKNQLSR